MPFPTKSPPRLNQGTHPKPEGAPHKRCVPTTHYSTQVHRTNPSPYSYPNKHMSIQSCLRCCFLTTPKFLWNGVRLFGYVICLSPMFVRFLYFYFVASHRTSVRYESSSQRQTLDIYTPNAQRRRDSLLDHDHLDSTNNNNNNNNSKPIVFFCCGGAWIIGYKMWGCLLARFLCQFGYTCVLPDYRNYPFGTIPDMIQDVQAALTYTCQHYPNLPIVAVGQSAGGHLLMTQILKTVLEERPVEIVGLVCLSGPLKLSSIQETFTRHGLDDQFIRRLFDDQVDDYDPNLLLERIVDASSHLNTPLPPIRIFHGDGDATVPQQGSQEFAQALTAIHPDTQVCLYQGWSHTDPILEGPADGDHRFHRDLVDLLNEWSCGKDDDATDHVVTEIPDNHPALKRLCPHVMVQMARCCMPFK